MDIKMKKNMVYGIQKRTKAKQMHDIFTDTGLMQRNVTENEASLTSPLKLPFQLLPRNEPSLN